MTEPHFFLTESDLDELERVRGLVANMRASTRAILEDLRKRATSADMPLLDLLEADSNGLHTLLVAALDARTAELTDEAVGYKRPAG